MKVRIAHSLRELADDIADRLTECLGARRLTALPQRDKTNPQRRVSGAEAHIRDPTAVGGGGTWRNEIDQRPAQSIADGAARQFDVRDRIARIVGDPFAEQQRQEVLA